MPIIYRQEKGSPLTIPEIDNNFRELDTRILNVEKSVLEVEGLKKVSLKGDQLIFEGTFGATLGTCSLPVLLFQPRGEWQKDQPYGIYDIVSQDQKLFYCTKNHTSGNWQDEQSFWNLLIDGSALGPPEKVLRRGKGKKEKDEDSEASSDQEEDTSSLKDFDGQPSDPLGSMPSSAALLPLYDIDNLPKPSLGKMGLLVGGGTADLIIATTDRWIRVRDQAEVSEEGFSQERTEDPEKDREEEEEGDEDNEVNNEQKEES